MQSNALGGDFSTSVNAAGSNHSVSDQQRLSNSQKSILLQYLYDTSLSQDIGAWAEKLQKQEDAGGFSRSLTESRFRYEDEILQLILGEYSG